MDTPTQLKIAHLCMSAVSNLPKIWSDTLNEFTPSRNRHIYGGSHLWHGWTTDYHLCKQPECIDEVIAEIEQADLLVCYAQTHPERAFGTHNFCELMSSRPIVYVMALEPYVNWAWEYSMALWTVGASSPRPLVVTADMMDAYPQADLVPIHVPAHTHDYRFAEEPPVVDETIRILLASTNDKLKRVGCMKQAIMRLGQLTRRKIELELISELTHVELLERKRNAHLVLDLLTSGGWGLNGCEAGAVGRATLARFSPGVCDVYDKALGCGPPKAISVDSEDPELVARALLPFVEDDALRRAHGRETRAWVERYWSSEARAPLIWQRLTERLEMQS